MTVTAYELLLSVPDPKLLREKDSGHLLNANDRKHWTYKSRNTQYWRDRAFALAIGACNSGRGRRLERARVTMWFRWPDEIHRDVANMAPTAKALMDGLVDARLIPDDDDSHLEGPFLKRDPGKAPRSIRIAIEELPAL